MLFGDSKRFERPFVSSSADHQLHGVSSHTTDDHVGPGSYFAYDMEQKRGGWKGSSFSQRPPMNSPNKASDRGIFARSNSYTNGHMTSYGVMAHSSPSMQKSSLPGPGYYERDIFKAHGTISSGRSPIASPSGGQSVCGSVRMDSASKRFAFERSAILRDGVLFLSAENEKREIGPGQYTPRTGDLNKRSFNIRASPGKNALSPSLNRKQSVDEIVSNAGSYSSRRRERAKSAPRYR